MSYIDSLPSKSAIFEHWKDRLPELGILIDWGEPGCWACGFFYGPKYDIKRPDAGWAKILQCWDDIPLQRCHIVPRSLGGSHEVSNLFLMCRECHDMQPNTSVPEIFFRWARAQSAEWRDFGRIREAMRAFGIDESDVTTQTAIQRVMDSAAFQAWQAGKFGLHRPQSNYPSRLTRLTPATVIGLALYYDRNMQGPPSPEGTQASVSEQRMVALLQRRLKAESVRGALEARPIERIHCRNP